ncbi:acyl-CoA dehydrogenase family protein [Hazenella sp. IB182357]|uniref:Acyl-CoA dehydrogenase family protein n=1 Tax=Polycladospora coralii TaxID=2771432 RepID=A0A926RW09_9BACL|nr:acyl-CoA dehydrogenase family protein [Polycladospora coralii]MBD1370981.1 acyl-CoA dehydrogenase family protein [Polycladospora coralii]
MNTPYIQSEHQILRESVRKFLNKEAKPYFDTWEKNRIVPRDFWIKMGEQGFLCPWLEESYGGIEADFAYSVVLVEELERMGTGLMGISLHSDVCVPYIYHYGNEEQKKKWLPGCTSGELITAVAMTEPGTGSDLANIKTTAILDGDHYVVNGQKTFISNGIHSDLIILVCKTDPHAVPAHAGISLLVVEADTPGFSRGRKLDKIGLHSQDTAELMFDDCRVPKANLLGIEGSGFKYLMEKLQPERLLATLMAQVSAEDALEMTLAYVKTRTAFGKPLSKQQHIQFKMADLATEVSIGRTYIDDLIVKHMQGVDVVTQVSMAKAWITEMAKRVTGECLQLHGGYGYMEEYPIARRYRDIPVSAIYAGTNEIMKMIIAKNLGL